MIVRSIGYLPRVGDGVVPTMALPGGGYDGLTKVLDDAVMCFAKWLEKRFRMPVQVRFNSNRRSGGAFISPAHSLAITRHGNRDFEIGLCAFLVPPSKPSTVEREFDESSTIGFEALIGRPYLVDESDLENPDAEFAYWEVETRQEAYRLLRRKLKAPWKGMVK